jgi:hypothetical protein
MRQIGVLCGLVLILAFRAGAQAGTVPSLLVGSPMPAFALSAPSASAFAAMPGASALALPPEPEPEPAPQGVYGVLQNYDWQVYAGYTHFVFYELPGVTGNLNGFDMSVVYYPHGGHWAGDGEFMAAFAPQDGVNTTMVLAVGGARYRVQISRGIELWGHGMVGVAHFTPETAFGGTSAFAFDVGGGVDLIPRRGRLSYRAAVDMVGTRFFGTHQYNPKVSIGVVYKF